MRTRNPLSLGAKKRPTKRHRAAVWECMLGTVYAANRAGEVRYFDYDYDAAVEHAELSGCDLRTYRQNGFTSGVRPGPYGEGRPRNGQYVLWRRVPDNE